MHTKVFFLALTCLIAGLCAAVYGNSPINDNSRVADLFYKQANAPQTHRAKCNNLYTKGSERVSCRSINNPETQKTELFVWGDSHASMMIYGLEHMSRKHGFNLEYSVLPGCLATLKMQRTDRNANCSAAHDRVAQHLKQSPVPLVLLMSSYVHNTVTGRSRSIHSPRKVERENSISEFSESFQLTVNTIKSTGAKVVVLTEPPRHRLDPVIEKMKKIMVGRNSNAPPTTHESHKSRISQIYSIIDSHGIDLRLDFTSLYCNNNYCTTELDEQSLYADRSHLSIFGSMEISKLLVSALKSSGYL